MTIYDVIIVGAGAAGLAAGRTLHDAGRSILTLEARDRIGGRIHTDYDFAAIPIEFGAEFIHGDHAVTVDLVKSVGLHTLPVVRMGNLRWSDGVNPALPLARLPDPLRQTLTGLLQAYEQLPNVNLPQDVSLADYLRGRSWTGEALAAADVLLAQTCCAHIETLSCHDLIREMRVDTAGHGESRIREGYGKLLDWYRADYSIHFNSLVQEIQWGDGDVRIISNGQVYRAKTCIITVPVSLLQNGLIRFTPALPPDKQWAIHAFRMEAATKLIYRFRERLWDENLTFMAHTGLTARWWTPSYGREEDAVIACYVTAERAQKIDALDEATALDIGLRELSTLLDIPLNDLSKAVITSKRLAWAADPLALGGYAHVPTGMAECRPLLARPEGNRLFFAGEATAYDTNPQTVHGAIESGWRAARECLAVL
ncbi:MAG: amine oxidase [Chloroflexota bacterium]|nr:FAD-dependent oxidoreductase [Chloroflexota bacterium]NOG62549.1 FAD-dependent oxidoreductase [Chloroflexota bacterium]GIK64243.1 MAG: amine oxidase [Chloroflexota bacterium]